MAYNNDDVIITDENETMTFEEAKKFHSIVYRLATKQETEEFNKENEYWRKQDEDQQQEGSYHDLDF